MSYATKRTSLGQVDVSSVPGGGIIRSKNGFFYQLTPEDLLWLARSVQYEAGNHAATAWTYAQRLAMARGNSLKNLVQAHSQPINPIWRRDGDKCRPGGTYHDRDECSERRLAVRDQAASLPWASVRPEVRETIVKFATGRLPNPVPRAANFANAPVTQGYLSRNPTSAVVLRDGNWYITERATNSWPADFVTIESDGRIAGPAIVAGATVAGAVGLVAAAGFAWWAYSTKYKKRR